MFLKNLILNYILVYNYHIGCSSKNYIEYLKTLEVLEYKTTDILQPYPKIYENGLFIKVIDLQLTHIFLTLLNDIEKLTKEQKDSTYKLLKSIRLGNYDHELKIFAFHHPNKIIENLVNLSDQELAEIINISKLSDHYIKGFF